MHLVSLNNILLFLEFNLLRLQLVLTLLDFELLFLQFVLPFAQDIGNHCCNRRRNKSRNHTPPIGTANRLNKLLQSGTTTTHRLNKFLQYLVLVVHLFVF